MYATSLLSHKDIESYGVEEPLLPAGTRHQLDAMKASQPTTARGKGKRNSPPQFWFKISLFSVR